MKIAATTSETRKKEFSKSSITSWILFHGIFMTSCDKILNQDVLTRNRCYGGATSLCGTRLAHVCQEPVSTTLDLLCVCFGSSTLSVLRVKKQGPGRWARCPRQYFLPALHWATRILVCPRQASLLVGEMMNWRIGHVSCYRISYEFTNRDIWMCLTLPSFLSLRTWRLIPCFSSAPASSLPANSSCSISPSVQTLYLLQSLTEVSVAMTPFLLTNPGLWGSLSFEPTLYPTPCVGRHVITALTENLLFHWITSVFFNKVRTIFLNANINVGRI